MAVYRRSKNGGGGGGGGKKKAKQNAEKKAVASTALPWSAVSLPLEASANAGQSDADFFQGFSYEDDDFMGLTEVDGVEVTHGEDGIVRFVVEEGETSAKGKGKAKGKPIVEVEKAVKGRAKKEKKLAAEEKDDTASTSTDPTVTLPPIHFDAEEVDEDEDASSTEQEQDGELDVDFAFFANKGNKEESEKGEAGVHKWTAKDMRNKLPGWKRLKVPLHPSLCQALFKLDFRTPTEIQAATLPASIPATTGELEDARDVVGVAQTGSGKTLAYGLPMLQWIASLAPEDRQMDLMANGGDADDTMVSRLAGLVLTPTRELALQVSKHLRAIVEASSVADDRWASVATVTGGMSEEKQRRMLQGYRGRGVDIIVATPGRLWDMCKGDDGLTRRIKTARFLAVDEADRMIETGHFAELEHIFALVQRAELQRGEDGHATAHIRGGAPDMQTFIYSATLSKDLQHNLKRVNRRRKRSASKASTLDELLQAIDFRDDDPLLVDQSTLTGVAHDVVEVKAECLANDKDVHLYYFLLRYPGRTLVFVNAIDGIRRLQPLLEQLQIAVQPLHSQLQQKQRLKSMDRFRAHQPDTSSGSVVLLATDVAARGLDIPAVDHVVHFQLPRTADTYVHRSGRTGRAGQSGIALALVDPTEKRLWRDLCKNLGRTDDLPSMPIEYSLLAPLRERVELAREIDKAVHTQKKASHDDAWLRKLAQDAEMDMSGEEEELDPDHGGGGKGQKGKDKNVMAMRAQLREMISTPLRTRGISSKYITSGSRDFLDTLLNDQQHSSIIGVARSTVQSDLPKPKAAAFASTKKKKANAGAQPAGQKRKRG